MIKTIILSGLKIYKRLISPLLPHACRFQPTCSEYMMQAITQYGILKGGYYGLKRLLKCHPWGDSGYDPIPSKDIITKQQKDSH